MVITEQKSHMRQATSMHHKNADALRSGMGNPFQPSLQSSQQDQAQLQGKMETDVYSPTKYDQFIFIHANDHAETSSKLEHGDTVA